MKYKNYLMSFHGLDIGLIYNLPKNVRVYMYCFAGKEVDAADWNEAATWYMATLDESKYDKHGKFMEKLTLTLDSDNPKSKCAQYCVFSGNLSNYNMNRIPDLYLEDELYNFKTGLYQLPAQFDRIFLKDKYSAIDNKYYKPGDRASIDVKMFNKKIKPFIRKKKELPNEGFLTYFINPGSINKSIKNTDFVVVPKKKYFNSYLDLSRKTNKPLIDLKETNINKDPIKLNSSSFRIPKRKSNKHNLEQYQWDLSKPNTSNIKESNKVKKLQKSLPGLYLSDVIRYLCNKNQNKYITLVVSSCRKFHDELPNNIQKNQLKTSTVSASEYTSKYSSLEKN